jgi:glycosyltransferase involved in cell wall biosynthesis
MLHTPILIISDSPSGSTGLGVVTREIALRAQQHLSDVCYVGVAGYGAGKENHFPFPVFPFSEFTGGMIPQLPWIWKQFAGERKGVILTIGNIAWLPPFAYPKTLHPGELRDFLMSDRFNLWSYVPVDSVCLNEKLSGHEEKIMKRLGRVLAYTKFGADAIDRTLGNDLGTTPHIPHGTDSKIFYPRSRKEARATLTSRIGRGNAAVGDDVILVFINATNTARKDWALGIEVCGRLVEKGYNIGLLIHTNRMLGDWNLTELCLGFGLQGRTIESTRPLDREDVAWLYAASDCVLGIGSGEGWGLTHSEAMACGIPVVHGRYAGGAEFMPREWTVKPCGWRYESVFSNKRPVFNPDDWVKAVESVWTPSNHPRPSLLGEELMWDHVWEHFEQWIREGLQ